MSELPQSPGRTLYVLIPPSPLFAAHWSFFIPDASSFDPGSKRLEEPTSGRRIHVSGDRLNGFALEIVRDYDLSKHRSVRKYSIAMVSSAGRYGSSHSADRSSLPHKDEEEGGGYIDSRPLDEFERICVEIEAPGPSLNRIAGGVDGGGKRVKAEVKDCQWWVRQVVKTMEVRGILAALPSDEGGLGKSPSEMVATLPVH